MTGTKRRCDQAYRLPTFVVPSEYFVFLSLSVRDSKFRGMVDISVQLLKPTAKITLSAVSLDVIQATVNGYQAAVTYTPELEQLHLKLDKKLAKGPAIISIDYIGRITEDLKGLYLSSYRDSHNQEHFVLATQFESTFARRALPCFDEPGFKASFTLSVEIDAGLEAYSNMPIQKIARRRDKRVVAFEPTPPMPSYDLALVIGEYQALTMDRFSVVAPPGNLKESEFGLHVAITSISTYERLLGVDYSLPKLDLIAVPESGSGAMENWGLVTFSRSALLEYPNSSTADKFYAADTIAHELAHQFFGNLCTTKWWDTTWLNEGIATYFEYIGLDAALPEWKVWQTFINRVQQAALEADSLQASTPLNNRL
jgi:aminopeptidase N